ncbi:MAG: precorrin-8X methylmutase [Cyanophyceae cyanobacterium]
MDYITIKELTDAVGEGITPRMVRHYHQIGLMPQPPRSPGNYRLYTEADVQRLKRIAALKQQGFQLAQIQNLLEADLNEPEVLLTQLQRQYQMVMQQIAQLRHTASALEHLLGRDRHCQSAQAKALSHLKQLEAETQTYLHRFDWSNTDGAVHQHPEAFQESLSWLMPDLGNRSEIEIDLLSRLVLACGDVSLVSLIRLSRKAIGEATAQSAIAASREALKGGCAVVGDIPTVTAALDQTRLSHLGCQTTTLINDPHITDAIEAEQAFWQQRGQELARCPQGCILVIGYAPSVLLAVCEAIEQQVIHPALVIGMPLGFSHAPSAKRRLMHSGVPFITTAGSVGGGLLAATALNALAESLIAKPNCHCYLSK